MLGPLDKYRITGFLEQQFRAIGSLLQDSETGLELPSFEGLDYGDLRKKLHIAETNMFRSDGPAPGVRAPHIDSEPKDLRKSRKIEPFTKPIFHQQIYQDFLCNLDRMIRAKTSTGRPPDLASVYATAVDLPWQARGRFMGERELVETLVGEYCSDILEKELPRHKLTGFVNQFKTPLALALAHDYSNIGIEEPGNFIIPDGPAGEKIRSRELSLVLGDISNIAGTNNYFRGLLITEWQSGKANFNGERWQQLGLSDDEITALNSVERADGAVPDELRDAIITKAAEHCTDWVVRIMMDRLAKVFKNPTSVETREHYAEQVQLLGAGGDEFDVILAASEEQAQQILAEAMTAVTKLVEELKLNDFVHPKHKSPGLGLSMYAETMQNKSDYDLKTMSPKTECLQNEILEVYDSATASVAENRARLDALFESLAARKYQDLNPLNQVEQFNPAEDLVLVDAPETRGRGQDQRIEHCARRQLFNVFNPATGVQDTMALPIYIRERVADGQDLKLVSISLENLAAVNDNIDQERANEIQGEFARRLNKLVKEVCTIEGAQVFSDHRAAGKFYVLMPSDANQAYVRSVCSAAALVATVLNQQYKVGSLANPKRPEEHGLSVVALNLAYKAGQIQGADWMRELGMQTEVLERKVEKVRELRQRWHATTDEIEKSQLHEAIASYAVS